MYRILKIGDKDVPMKAAASVDYYYKKVFHVDPIELQSSGDVSDGTMVSFCMQMGFIMAMFAKFDDRKKMLTLTEDDYIEWLDNFERDAYLEALLDIRLAYENQNATMSEAKKKNDEQSEE